MKLMIDPPGGWKYGFPKYLSNGEAQAFLDYDLAEIEAWLIENGYPEKDATEMSKWTRTMWVHE